jgi:hypothetical protein
MYEAYLDETGTDYAGRICALAGFLSTPDRWNALRDQWRAICDRNPRTPDFHAYDAHNLKGEYWGWTQDQTLTLAQLEARRDGRLIELAGAIRTHCMHSLTVAIDLPAYRRVIEPRFPRQPNMPYFIMFWHLQMGVAKWLVENDRAEPVQFNFDDFSVFGRRAARWHAEMLGGLPDAAAKVLKHAPKFGHDQDEPALKAADLFAWHLQRDVSTRVKSGDAWEPTMQATPLLIMKEVPPIGQLLTDQELSDLLPIIEAATI